MSLLKKALHGSSTSGDGGTQKLKVPEPKAFKRDRNAKILENFLWDMEQYFRAARVPEGEWVNITSMYLNGDAKLWWRTRVMEDASSGRPTINTWAVLKRELKGQFLPCNAAWVAREALKNLKHKGTVRAYVTKFSTLMLDIQNMSEEDKLFNFMSGLQTWAQVELRRRGVTNLPTAMAAAEALVDFDTTNRVSNNNVDHAKNGKPREGKFVGNTEGKSHGDSTKPRDHDSDPKGKGKAVGCFLCDGPHYARDCPKKVRLSAIFAEEAAREASGHAEEEEYVYSSALQITEG